MKSITVTLTDHEERTERLLTSLRSNSLKDYVLYVWMRESNVLAKKRLDVVDWIPKVIITGDQKSESQATFKLLTRAFRDGSTLNLEMGRASAMARDTTTLIEWVRAEGMFRQWVLSLVNEGPGTDTEELEWGRFSIATFGFVITSLQWMDLIQPSWADREEGWHEGVVDSLDRSKVWTIRPKSRRIADWDLGIKTEGSRARSYRLHTPFSVALH